MRFIPRDLKDETNTAIPWLDKPKGRDE